MAARFAQIYMAWLIYSVTIWTLISVELLGVGAHAQISFPEHRSTRQAPLPDLPDSVGATLNFRALGANNYRNFYRNRNYFVRDDDNKPEHNTVVPLHEGSASQSRPPPPAPAPTPPRSPTPPTPNLTPRTPKIEDTLPTNDPILFEDMDMATPYSANAYLRPLPPLDIGVTPPAPSAEPPSTANTQAVTRNTPRPVTPVIGSVVGGGGGKKFEPAPDGNPPPCAEDAVYCEVSTNYPKALLNSVLERSITPEEFQQVYGDTTDNSTKITDIKSILQRTGLNTGTAVEETPLCSAVEHTIYPQIARNKDNKWLYVVNHDEYIQGVRIEKCLDEGQSCFYGDTGPAGYHTACRQKYIYKKLLALTPEGRTSSESFKLPSCCACFVKTASIADRLLGVHTHSAVTPAIRPVGSVVGGSSPTQISRPRPASSGVVGVTKLPASYSYAYENENQDDIDNSTEIFITTQSMEGLMDKYE